MKDNLNDIEDYNKKDVYWSGFIAGAILTAVIICIILFIISQLTNNQ